MLNGPAPLLRQHCLDTERIIVFLLKRHERIGGVFSPCGHSYMVPSLPDITDVSTINHFKDRQFPHTLISHPAVWRRYYKLKIKSR